MRLDTRPALSVHTSFGDATAGSSPGDVLASHLRRQLVSPGTPQDLATLEGTQDSEPDVLIIHWDLRHLPFPLSPTTPSLAYSARLQTLASKLTRAPAPYLAIHWRTETVPPDHLPACADALVDTLSTLLADPTLARGVEAVWLATDVPPVSAHGQGEKEGGEGGPAQRSNTFKEVTAAHADALDVVHSAFEPGGPLEAWRLTGLAQEMRRVRAELAEARSGFSLVDEDFDGLIWQDAGVWGILDKMAAMEATLFVSGARGCGRVSSFTRQIVEYRTEGKGKHIPRNVVELFG
ncbi:hypothetical protein BDW22DRAFT_1340131 [Trametopsis cervina]|nr:hypothetical protein BDW22DRAFT_1340131 [Trametopsis cervina]